MRKNPDIPDGWAMPYNLAMKMHEGLKRKLYDQ
jgi:hypothetical protein